MITCTFRFVNSHFIVHNVESLSLTSLKIKFLLKKNSSNNIANFDPNRSKRRFVQLDRSWRTFVRDSNKEDRSGRKYQEEPGAFEIRYVKEPTLPLAVVIDLLLGVKILSLTNKTYAPFSIAIYFSFFYTSYILWRMQSKLLTAHL